MTRYGVVIRYDNVASLTPAGRQAMLDYGVATVIDLRSESEVKGAPGPPFSEFQSSSPATAITDGAIPVYRNIPLIDDATAPILNEAPASPGLHADARAATGGIRLGLRGHCRDRRSGALPLLRG